MRFTSALKHGFVILFILVVSLFSFPKEILAQPAPTTAPPPIVNTATWEFDPVVTEVGKNADRARQLLWWFFQHPGVHLAPVIVQIWSFTRNIVLVFVVMVIVAFGISLILGRRRGAIGPIFSGITSPVFGVNVPTIFVRIIGILLYVVFSYYIIVALIQASDIIMKFFIETVGGKDLFNIIFSGAGNNEANYITFVGYRDVNPLSLEMVNTSLFYIRATTLTYNVMSVILVLRTVILWFLLVIAPFLALLMPFVFIRNTGWIWIGVFFQWLFYGPIFALFLAALTRMWVAGIPYGFDFSRVNKPTGQVYRTAINILWGGPAQTLSPGNSANYVDTYAEYFIALVMLWAAIILPWLLLRIFRDYCCSMIAASANTLNSMFDRLRQFPLPPPPVPLGPTATSGMASELPFRQNISEKTRDVQRIRIEEIKNVSNVSTNELVKSMDLSVNKLSDISRLETNSLRKTEVASSLDKIRQPENIAQSEVREKYKEVRQELQQRALKGDRIAQTILQASDRQTQALTNQVRTSSRMAPIKVTAVVSPTITVAANVPLTNKVVVEKVADNAGLSEIRIKDVLSKVTIEDIKDEIKITQVANVTGVSKEKVKEIVQTADSVRKSKNVTDSVTQQIINEIGEADLDNQAKIDKTSKETGVTSEKIKEIVKTKKKVTTAKPAPTPAVSVEDYEEVKSMWLNHYRSAPIPLTENIKNRSDWLVKEEKQLTNITNLMASSNPVLKQQGLEKVSDILPFMLLGGFSENEIMTYLKAKLEAGHQVIDEMIAADKAKEKAREELKNEEEEQLVEVTKKEEKAKAEELVQSSEIPTEGMKIKSDKDKESGSGKDKV